MGLTVEQECPQCGGPIELDEADRLLRCPYCSVQNFLFASGYFRFVLPHNANGNEIIYAPYLRFKGNVYFCQGLSIGYRFIDITNAGVQCRGIPASLGLRPQALKMKFLAPETPGSFMKFSLKASDIVARASSLSTGTTNSQIFHRAYIGETLSLIYLPLYVKSGKIFDGILNRPISETLREQGINDAEIVNTQKWKVAFLPTICPKCGWNLEGEKDSVALCCKNCDTVLEASEGRFSEISAHMVPGEGKEAAYLPFWKITASTKGIDIQSFADFIRVTNQPVVVKKTWENEDMCFWSPAFKIRPKLFLQLSKQVTVSQSCFEFMQEIPRKNLYPVTLARTEAVQAMKIILASSALDKKSVIPCLPEVTFDIKDSSLVFLPFSDTGHEMVMQNMCISINKQAMMFGRQL